MIMIMMIMIIMIMIMILLEIPLDLGEEVRNGIMPVKLRPVLALGPDVGFPIELCVHDLQENKIGKIPWEDVADEAHELPHLLRHLRRVQRLRTFLSELSLSFLSALSPLFLPLLSP